jgi:hypothetical protein
MANLHKVVVSQQQAEFAGGHSAVAVDFSAGVFGGVPFLAWIL